MGKLKMLVGVILVLFFLPAAVSYVVWQADDSRPKRWNQANWSSAGLLPPAETVDEAVVHVMAARTGRWKGAFAVHTWIVLKQANENQYTRYEVVGWGTPLRENAYAPDARWYSNKPEILHSATGENAEKMILDIERIIFSYPYANRGDYQIWPGPNSNTFVAHVLDKIPEAGWVLPSSAIGRDRLAENKFIQIDPDWMNIQISAGGFAGLSVGRRHGFELHLVGLVFGFDFKNLGLKLPGFGTVSPLSPFKNRKSQPELS